MPGRVLERAVDVWCEPLHFFCEFFFLVRFRLVAWSAGHGCGAAAGVQLYRCARRLACTWLLRESSVLVRAVVPADRLRLVSVASAIRAVADSLQLGARARLLPLRRVWNLAYRETLALFLAALVTTKNQCHSPLEPSQKSFHLQF